MKPELELLFKLTMTGQPNDLGQTPYGKRRFVQITGGSFQRPELSGEVWLNRTLAISTGEPTPITDKGIGMSYTVYRVLLEHRSCGGVAPLPVR